MAGTKEAMGGNKRRTRQNERLAQAVRVPAAPLHNNGPLYYENLEDKVEKLEGSDSVSQSALALQRSLTVQDSEVECLGIKRLDKRTRKKVRTAAGLGVFAKVKDESHVKQEHIEVSDLD